MMLIAFVSRYRLLQSKREDILSEQGLSRLIKDRVLAEAQSLVNFTLEEVL